MNSISSDIKDVEDLSQAFPDLEQRLEVCKRCLPVLPVVYIPVNNSYVVLYCPLIKGRKCQMFVLWYFCCSFSHEQVFCFLFYCHILM